MILRSLALCALLAPVVLAGDFSKLPAWAEDQANAAATEAPPPDVDAWVLLDRTEFAYRGDGEIRKRNYRLVRILTERGLDEGHYIIHGLGGRASMVKQLKGWNLRPDGELTKFDQDFNLTFSGGSGAGLTASSLTFNTLDRVAKGSYVAFQSEEVITNPLGPLCSTTILETNPVRVWEIELVKSVGWFTRTTSSEVGVHLQPRHFPPWFPEPEPGATSLRLVKLQALPRNESAHPDPHNVLPQVLLTFSDPSLKGAPDLSTWDSYARWSYTNSVKPAPPFRPIELGEKTGLEALTEIHRWMVRELTYKIVYLTPDRSWTPEPPETVARLRFGDCKDLAGFFIAAVKGAGMEAFPVEARIMEGFIEDDEPVGPFAINHAIAAVRLDHPSGLPAEVATPRGRFLLVDLTDKFTPLGYLDRGHRDRRVLICMPEGAVWVRVPAQATLQPKVEIHMEAGPMAGGALKGTLSILETGDALGLRGLALAGGTDAVKERLASLLKLPVGSPLVLEPVGDPLATQETFQVRVAFELPRALTPNGTEWRLPSLGLPSTPAAIQRPGQTRRYPVSVASDCLWEFEAVFHDLPPLRPVTPAAALKTPFRTVTWAMDAQGPTWTLRFREATHDVDYPFERREEGVQAQRSDWKRMEVFMEDALSVALLP